MDHGWRGDFRLALLALGTIFLVGSLTLRTSQMGLSDLVGTVALSLPFLILGAWAWASGDRAFGAIICASALLLAVRVEVGGRVVEKGDLVPIPVEVVVVYLLFRLGRGVWHRWKARQLET
ncbi:MAG: hypothetical protein ACRDXD_10715 [Acidimicrobiia bacterium]